MRAHHIILLLACATTNTLQLSMPIHRFVYDVTKQLQRSLNNKTIVTSCIENLASQHEDKEKLSVFYEIDCDPSRDCDRKFAETQILEGTIKNNSDMDLILSWTVNQTSIENAWKMEKLNINYMLNSNANLLVNLHKSLECANVSHHKLKRIFDMLKPRVPGIGFDEALVNCDKIPDATYPFIVLKFSFGESVGVTESFGLLHRRLNLLHNRQKQFIKSLTVRFSEEIPETYLYYPYGESVGDVCHQRLLASYGEQWATGFGKEMGLIIPTPNQETNERTTTNKFQLIARMFREPVPDSPRVLDTFSQQFNSVYIHYSKWAELVKLAEARRNQHLSVTLDTSLEIIVFGSWFPNEITADEIRLQDWKSTNEFKSLHVGALVFPISETYAPHEVPRLEFAKRMSSDFIIGCRIWTENPEKIDEVIKACDEINGNLYYLYGTLWLENEDLASESYSFYFENEIKPRLQNLSEFSNLILQRKPNARIVVDLIILANFRDARWTITNFCNDQLLYINEHYEAILNWAKCKNVEIVLKSPISEEDRPYLAWLTQIKPVSGNSYETHKLAEVHPYFVMRNYPKNVNNWTVDSCINWEVTRPEFKYDYFHNKYVGTLLDTGRIRKNGTLAVKEYKIMLQFVNQIFYLSEIILSSSMGDLFAACNWLQSRSNVNEPNSKVLLNYRVSETKNAKTFDGLPLLFEKLKENTFKSIQGLHFEFSSNSSSCIKDSTHPIFKTTVLVANKQLLNFKIGIVMDYKCCMEYIELIVCQNSSSLPILGLLNKLGYLVCEEKHEVKSLVNFKTMGNVLDSQLYLKKAFEEFSPNLELYFRVTLTDLPRAANVYSEAYMKTVSHFMQSGTAYGISYLIIQAFDEEKKAEGWWKIKNFSDLSDPYTYVEKESEHTNKQMWRPVPLIEESIPEPNYNSNIIVIASTIAGVLLTLSLALSSIIYLRYRKLARVLSDEEVKDFINGRSNCAKTTGVETRFNAEYIKFNTEFNLRLSELQIDTQTILGSGNFGTVYKGAAKETPAAIKQPKKDCSKSCFKSILCEVKILCYIGAHPNIVGFLGAYTKEIYKGVLFIATEFCSNGSLESFLRTKENFIASKDEYLSLSVLERESVLSLEDLYRFCFEIANGMEHIERMKVVHGDLSTRNVLLDDNNTCKIGDFGLSRKLYDYEKYVKKSQEPLPWKWMAYESLTKMIFTSKSDVWGYGVTIWEIFTLGSNPYSTFNWTIEFPNELENGLRLSKPKFSSKKIYMKMVDCWKLDPELRPTFTDISDFFKELYNNQYTVLEDG